MPNGRYILNDLEFEKQIKEMSDRELMEFSARLGYTNCIRIQSLENRSKKAMGATAGIAGILGVAIASVIDYFLRR